MLLKIAWLYSSLLNDYDATILVNGSLLKSISADISNLQFDSSNEPIARSQQEHIRGIIILYVYIAIPLAFFISND